MIYNRRQKQPQLKCRLDNFLISEHMQEIMIEGDTHASHHSLIRLRGRQMNTTIIQCHARTNDSDDEVKTDFMNNCERNWNQSLGMT